MLEKKVQHLEQELLKLHQKLDILSEASKKPLKEVSMKEVDDIL